MTDLIERLRLQEAFDDRPALLCLEAARELEAMQKLYDVAVADRVRMHQRIAELEQLAYELDDWFRAYPEDIFTPLQGDPIKKTGDYDTEEKRNLITRASASMARHMIQRIPDKIKQALKGEGDE